MGTKARFIFEYKSHGQPYHVIVEGYDLNQALLRFANMYREIEEIYSVKRVTE